MTTRFTSVSLMRASVVIWEIMFAVMIRDRGLTSHEPQGEFGVSRHFDDDDETLLWSLS